MANQEQVEKWISEFEATGEQTVRDNINFRGVLMGEEKLSTALTWLRNQERQREKQVTAALNYIRWTFWVAVAAAVFVVGTFAVVVVVLVLHR
jgi:CHASE3 domain sensor protein